MSRPLDLVLHIGMGKTGTSSIQNFLHRNRARLADAGVLYPRTPGRARHVRLSLSVQPEERLGGLPAWRRLGANDPKAFRQTFRHRLSREIHKAGLARVLFSDEGLYGLPDEALRNLSRFVGGIADGLRVVVYLRRQEDHLVSHYQQVVKVGETRRLTERIQQADYSKIHDYHARLRSWQRLMEPDAFIVRRFEPDEFVEGSIYQDFFEAAAIPARADVFEQVGSRNESLDARAVEFLRIANLLRKADPAGRLLPSGNAMVPRLADAADGPTLTAPDSVLDEFMARWEASNKAVARDFLDDDEPLFRTPRKTRNTTTDQYLDPTRLEYYITLLDLPEQTHAPLRALVEREAKAR
jgi:hypothetical protein